MIWKLWHSQHDKLCRNLHWRLFEYWWILRTVQINKNQLYHLLFGLILDFEVIFIFLHLLWCQALQFVLNLPAFHQSFYESESWCNIEVLWLSYSGESLVTYMRHFLKRLHVHQTTTKSVLLFCFPPTSLLCLSPGDP